jgi:hypothetical protein
VTASNFLISTSRMERDSWFAIALFMSFPSFPDYEKRQDDMSRVLTCNLLHLLLSQCPNQLPSIVHLFQLFISFLFLPLKTLAPVFGKSKLHSPS